MSNEIVPRDVRTCNTVQQFFSQQFGVIRTVEADGKVLFVASDVASALGYKNTSEAIKYHCKGVAKRYILTTGGSQEMNVIPEGDIYRLAAKSELPGADAFESWIFDEVIPAIRKTGTYTAPMSSLEIMRNMIDAQIQSEKRMDKLEAKIQAAFEKPAVVDWCKWANDKINYIVESQLLNHQKYRGDLYAELEQTARCNLEARQTQLRKRLRESGHTYKECKAVSKLHVIDADPKLRAIFEGIVKRESARC